MHASTLEEAYQETSYYICDTQCEKMLEVDKPSAKIANLLKSLDNKGGVFISAWNPFDQKQSAQKNARANEQLKADLHALKLHTLEGFSLNADNSEREDSYFAWPISEEQAALLGKKYRQKTVVFVENQGVAKLLHTKL